jgi:hypothetical protein
LPLSHIMLLIRHAPNPNRFDLMSLGIGVWVWVCVEAKYQNL